MMLAGRLLVWRGLTAPVRAMLVLRWLAGTNFASAIHLFCFLAFLALPFLNIVRFDIPKQRFYFAGYELWINEFAIIFFAMMFLMFLVVAS